jgi:7,8-dihydropterin-6-yl-methyl-4-(beta-D-ribofuranosyl)aminobenzene 5'-phosphate synthase
MEVKLMKILTLVENTSVSEKYKNEHGLCLYIETEKHKCLFDLGASGLFAENAQKLGINLGEVDLVVISHGHYDHGGGLEIFLGINKTAKIYVNQKAFNQFYSNRGEGSKAYIGLNLKLLPNERFVFVEDNLVIDDELELFSNVQGDKFKSSANFDLFIEMDGVMVGDDFAHEQNLIIHEGNKTVLFAGCAHNGIANILDHLNLAYKIIPDDVIGGFHLYNPSRKKSENTALIENISHYLLSRDTTYYTCHCTGTEPYQLLRELMGDRIH